ncbi:cupin domain-containing protein [Luminiphilus sp.]|nr:cupin domain-containing protein [Luminiphilus sp.]
MSAGITTTPEGDLLANIHELEWLDVGGGTQFKILRLCEKTGQWALYVHMDPGARFQAHRHEGTGQFFIMSGELIYDVGTAAQGTYGFEPIFAEHRDAHCVVETEMLFLGEGAVTYFTPEGEIDYVFNAMTLKAAQAGDGQLDIGSEG